MHVNEPTELRGVAAGLCLLGATGSATLAWAHMRAIEQIGVICGAPPSLHCGWCASAVILGLSAIALIVGIPRPTLRRAHTAAAKPRIPGEHP